MTKTFAVISGIALGAHAAFAHSPSMGTANVRMFLAAVFIVCLIRMVPAIVDELVDA